MRVTINQMYSTVTQTNKLSFIRGQLRSAQGTGCKDPSTADKNISAYTCSKLPNPEHVKLQTQKIV